MSRGGPGTPAAALRLRIEELQTALVTERRANARIHTRAGPGGDLQDPALAWYASYWARRLTRLIDTELAALWQQADHLLQVERGATPASWEDHEHDRHTDRAGPAHERGD